MGLFPSPPRTIYVSTAEGATGTAAKRLTPSVWSGMRQDVARPVPSRRVLRCVSYGVCGGVGERTWRRPRGAITASVGAGVRPRQAEGGGPNRPPRRGSACPLPVHPIPPASQGLPDIRRVDGSRLTGPSTRLAAFWGGVGLLERRLGSGYCGPAGPSRSFPGRAPGWVRCVVGGAPATVSVASLRMVEGGVGLPVRPRLWMPAS